MRTIKFRGKRICTGEWVYGSYAPNTYDEEKALIITYFPYDPDYVWEDVDPATVGEYTGMKDKNGKEIYEDDILLDESGAYAVVYYSMGSFCVDFGEGFDLQYFTDSIHEICYVAGNIHDNPELLKGGEQ